MSTGVRITIDDQAVQGVFARLVAMGDDLTPVMTSVGAQLRQHVDERFEDERGPGGTPWPKSWRARTRGGQTLTDTARLRQSITFNAGRNQVEIGTNVAYAPVHQFGATIRAKTAKGLVFRIGGGPQGWRRVKQVTIPARPFLGLDAEDIAAIDDIVSRRIALLWGGGTGAKGGAA